MPPWVSSSEKSSFGDGAVPTGRSPALPKRVGPAIVSIRPTVPSTRIFRTDKRPRDRLDTQFIESKSFPTWLTESVLTGSYTPATAVMFQRSLADPFIPPLPAPPFH